MKQETSVRATLRDVARMAGVSLATASRAVSGASGYTVSPEKRARVMEVVTQLNYQPVTAAQRSGGVAGTARRTSNVGLVLRATYRFSDPFWSPVLDGVAEEVLRHGYHIRFSYILDDLAHAGRRRLLSPKFIDGLVLIGDMGLPAALAGWERPEPIVVIAGADEARWESDVRFDVITMEKLAAMDRLVGHLAALGRRHLGFMGPPPDRDDRRADGFVHSLARHGLRLNPDLFVECNFDTAAAYAATLALLGRQRQALDALVCACDTMAIGAMRAAKECGLRLPDDLAITGFDDIPFSRDLDPPLTTIAVPKEMMGELAARRLIERINHPDWPPIIQTVPTSLVVRASCGAAVSR